MLLLTITPPSFFYCRLHFRLDFQLNDRHSCYVGDEILVVFHTRVTLYASFTKALLAGFTTIVDVALTTFSVALTQARRGHSNLDLQLGLQIDANVRLSVLDDEYCCCCIHAIRGISRRDAKRKFGSWEVQSPRKRFLNFEF